MKKGTREQKPEQGAPKERAQRQNRWYSDKVTVAVFITLRSVVIFTLIRCVLRREYESVFTCALTLALMVLPSIAKRSFRVDLPRTLECIILIFIFAAEILGELNNFYGRVPYWDTMLHVFNGFNCAAIGFSLVDMLNRSKRFTFSLSPIFLAVVAFCFSMTVGVLWEFFEFAGDRLLRLDMQKDTIVSAIASVSLNPEGANQAVIIDGIKDVIVITESGEEIALGVGGYLDIGLYDTMKDLLVNLIGAVVFSVIGYVYVKTKGKGKFAAQFIPRVKD